jgi:hypothetical protein
MALGPLFEKYETYLFYEYFEELFILSCYHHNFIIKHVIFFYSLIKPSQFFMNVGSSFRHSEAENFALELLFLHSSHSKRSVGTPYSTIISYFFSWNIVL